VQDVAGPPLAEPGDVGQLVAQTGRDQQPPRRDPCPALEQGPEPAAIGHQFGDGALDDVAAVSRHLAAADGQQFRGWEAVTGEVAVHVGGRGVAWLAGVDHEDLAAGPGEYQGRGQARGTSSDDHDVDLAHVPRLEPHALFIHQRC
jgi:hypothetical protein